MFRFVCSCAPFVCGTAQICVLCFEDIKDLSLELQEVRRRLSVLGWLCGSAPVAACGPPWGSGCLCGLCGGVSGDTDGTGQVVQGCSSVCA